MLLGDDFSGLRHDGSPGSRPPLPDRLAVSGQAFKGRALLDAESRLSGRLCENTYV